MDKLTTYRTLIQKLLQEHVDIAERNPSPTRETHLIVDEKRDRYMLFDTGWWDIERIHTPVLYVRLHQGRIWIEEDWTEDGLATELVAQGVPKDEIVLAFHHPIVRSLTEFAIA